MKLKRKSHPNQGAALLKWHMMAFIVFTVGLVWSIFSTLMYPGNASVLYEAWKPFISSRISMILAWGVVILVHMGVHQLRTLSYGVSQHSRFENMTFKPKNDALYHHLEDEAWSETQDDSGAYDEDNERLQSRL